MSSQHYIWLIPLSLIINYYYDAIMAALQKIAAPSPAMAAAPRSRPSADCGAGTPLAMVMCTGKIWCEKMGNPDGKIWWENMMGKNGKIMGKYDGKIWWFWCILEPTFRQTQLPRKVAGQVVGGVNGSFSPINDIYLLQYIYLLLRTCQTTHVSKTQWRRQTQRMSQHIQHWIEINIWKIKLWQHVV